MKRPQCAANRRHTDPPEQCRARAEYDSKFCKSHGGKHPTHHNKRVAKFFSKFGGPKLREALHRCAQESPDERLSLLEEVDITRTMALEAINTYEILCLTKSDATQDLKALAASSARNAINMVTDTVLRAARSRALNEATVDIEQLDFILNQVSRIVEEHVPPENVAAVREAMSHITLPDRARKQSELLKSRIDGVTDEIRSNIAMMDESVPE